jgi:RimJ/RimL family protein N-acetyltransferase
LSIICWTPVSERISRRAWRSGILREQLATRFPIKTPNFAISLAPPLPATFTPHQSVLVGYSGARATITLMGKSILALVGKGHGGAVWQRIRHRIHSKEAAYGLRRDLYRYFERPEAVVPLRVRPLEARDLDSLLSSSDDGEEEMIKSYQSRIVEASIPTCYVAADADDEACYMQWLIGPEQNQRIRECFGGIFPELAPDEALMEAAYTPKTHRGKHIMPAAMARIAERGLEMGVRWAITFVGIENTASLKGCKRAGFEPYVLRTNYWRWFRHRTRFGPLPGNLASGPEIEITQRPVAAPPV